MLFGRERFLTWESFFDTYSFLINVRNNHGINAISSDKKERDQFFGIGENFDNREQFYRRKLYEELLIKVEFNIFPQQKFC